MKLFGELFSWVATVVFAIILALTIIIFVFQPTTVVGSSMETTLHNGDMLIMTKVNHTLGIIPDYGDIVMLDSNINKPRGIKEDIEDVVYNNVLSMMVTEKRDDSFWVKRIIGKAGDVIEIVNGTVIRNKVKIEEPYIKEKMAADEYQKVVVPEGYVFVMGDNRNNSKDSRIIGCVPVDHILGQYAFKF